MRFDLAALIRRTRNSRRSQIILRDIASPGVLATNLYRIYLRVVQRWEARLPAIMAAYERRQVSDPTPLTTDALDDFLRVMSDIGAEMDRLLIELSPALRDWTMRVERWHRGRWRGNILTATGIDLGTLLLASGEPQAVADLLAWNTSLIRDVSDQTRQRVSSTVFAAFQQRTPVAEVARTLREVVGFSRQRSRRIAQDQTQKLAAALDRERQADAGIDRFKWRHSGKRHPRKAHVAHNGQIYTWDDPPMLEGKADRPGDAPFCGCRAQAVIDLD